MNARLAGGRVVALPSQGYFSRRNEVYRQPGPSPKKYLTLDTADPSGFPLLLGGDLRPLTIAYETYGTLNEAKSNAIMIFHALTGDSHVARHGPDEPAGWWEEMVGPGKPIDTDRWFVLAANAVGGCQGTTGPNSINPDTQRPYGIGFPIVTIEDMVRAQRELTLRVGIQRWKAVIGGSMGGMLALEWIAAYPESVERALILAAPASQPPHAIAYHEVGRQAICLDPAWLGGDYYGRTYPVQGLATARMLGMITYQSPQLMEGRFARKMEGARTIPHWFGPRFAIENYLTHQGYKLVARFDANSYLYLTRAMDLFDLGRNRGGLARALARIQAKVTVLGISTDVLYPAAGQRALVEAMARAGLEARYEEIESPHGHDAFLVEEKAMAGVLGRFLA